MAQTAQPFSAPALWLVERGREAYRLAATAEGPERQALLAIVETVDRMLDARGLPGVEDLEHWDDPPLTPEQSAAVLQWMETGEGPCPVP